MPGTDPRLSHYAVAGRGVTAATINHCIGALWNPHATKSIYVIVACLSTEGGSPLRYVQRITTKGTPGSTVTPGIDNDLDRLLAPISGAVLDLAGYSGQPTLAPPDFFRFMPAQSNPGPTHELYFGEDGLRLPAGTGLGVFQGTGVATTASLTFWWDE